MITIKIPTINDRLDDFDRLFDLWREVDQLGNSAQVLFDFSQCVFLRQNAVVFLGGLARLLQHRSGTVQFNWNSLASRICTNLAQNGFLKAFGHPRGPWRGNSIPYREDRLRSNAIVTYLTDMWLGRHWLKISPALQTSVAGKVWEIYDNAFAHSGSPIGVFSCGQHYPNRKILKLTIVDFGVGIPANVRLYKANPSIKANNALKWAFQPGTTTRDRVDNMSRGMGLDLLKQFVSLNKGTLEIFSHEGYAKVGVNGDQIIEIYDNRPTFFEGTLVNITLQCDESYYFLSSEKNDEPFF